jgi:hypothetical protein
MADRCYRNSDIEFSFRSLLFVGLKIGGDHRKSIGTPPGGDMTGWVNDKYNDHLRLLIGGVSLSRLLPRI